jgi:hypothetical protein
MRALHLGMPIFGYVLSNGMTLKGGPASTTESFARVDLPHLIVV